MVAALTDSEIDALIHESKQLPQDWQRRFSLKPKHGHKERELDVTGVHGSQFRVILRESIANPLGVSVILAYCPATTNQLFRLRRYNGKDHEHTNVIERLTFYGFHIHQATERYQRSGLREDAFAEPIDRFSSFEGAVYCMVQDCAFALPSDPQLTIPGLDW